MNKIFVRAFTFGLCLIITFVFSSCDTTYDSMIEEYNQCFVYAAGEKKKPAIDDSDFKDSYMIPEMSYKIRMESVFSICAPNGGNSYSWTVSDKSFTDDPDPIFKSDKKVLVFKPSASEYSIGQAYYLTLKVFSDKGESSDYAMLIIDEE